MNVKLIVCLLFLPILIFGQDRKSDTTTKNSVHSKGSIVNGQKEGTWEYFYPSGGRLAIEHFAQGQLNGEVSYFFQMEVFRVLKTGRMEVLKTHPSIRSIPLVLRLCTS